MDALTFDDPDPAPPALPEPLRGILRPIEWATLVAVTTEPRRVVAVRFGVTVPGLRARLKAIVRRLRAANLDAGSQIEELLKAGSSATRPLSGLRKPEQAELSRLFGDAELTPTPRTAATFATMRQLGAAARRRRCRGQQ